MASSFASFAAVGAVCFAGGAAVGAVLGALPVIFDRT
jgi:hypothetical protein